MAERSGGESDGAIFLGMGTNMGDRLRYLRRALLALADVPAVLVRQISPLFETEYVGKGEQAAYLNACVEIETTLEPDELLATLKAIEASEGRMPEGHMLPRPIDLDILLWGDKILSGPKLLVPHKDMRDRAFVLIPLSAIASEETFPDSGETIGHACANIRRKSGPWVRPFGTEELLPAGAADRADQTAGSFVWDLNKEDWRAALAVHCR